MSSSQGKTPSEGGRGGRGRKGGRGGGGGRGRGKGKDSTTKKPDSSSNKKTDDNKGKPQQQQQLRNPKKEEAVVSPEELASREEQAAKAQAAAEQKKVQKMEAAKVAAVQNEREQRTAAVREAIELLKTVKESALQHAENREQFQEANLKVSREDFEKRKKTLKADLKKCTTFVKKIKSGSIYSSKQADVLTDVASLNLSRYVEEVVSALLESRPKVGELPIMSVICQAMHVRYAEFLPNLLPNLWNVVLGKTKADNAAENSKLRRLYVRLLTEFVINGMIPIDKLMKCVTEWTGAAANYAVSDAVAVTAFCRAAGFEVLGITATSVLEAMQLIESENNNSSSNETATTTPVVARELLEQAVQCVAQLQPVLQEQRAVSKQTSEILAQYCLGAYQTLSTSLVATHHKLRKLEKRCEQDRLLSGALTATRESGLADARKLAESLQKTVEALSDCLNQPVPDLIEEEDDTEVNAGSGVEVWTKESGAEHLGPFDDEETRDFYCDIPDLLTTIPPALLGISEEEIERRKEENIQKYGEGNDNEEGEEEEEVVEVTEVPTSEEQFDAADEEEEDYGVSGEEDIAEDGDDEEENKDTPHYRLMLLLEQELPECNRREQIDELTEKFCTNHGSSKNSRKRLLKTLFLVPRSRLDLLPYYSRMAATLDRVWRDIAPSLVSDLEQQFHGQAKFKKNQNLDARMRTARYIGELTKFRVAPPIIALRCLQRCLEDFTGSNVDVACCILESCGRYLYRTKHTSARVSALMETMTRLGKAKNLDERSQSLLKSAFYSVKPPPSGPRKKAKEYPPLEAYLRYLLLVRLEPKDSVVSAVMKQLVCLPWDDPSYNCGALVCKLMLKACRRGRYKTIAAIAGVAAKLRTQRAAGEVPIRLIDACLEELRWALEHPNFRDQQRIITYARLLGELYCASLVSGQIILQQLYDFINLGHEIPDSLREASKKLAAEMAAAETVVSNSESKLPVYNSAGGVSQAIQEDEEMEDSELKTNVEETQAEPQPVAVSAYSKYDPRVPSVKDPPNSSYRITLVCTLLEVTARSLVSRNNIPRLQGFLAAFQRYLFTKTMLPTDCEFALLDAFDILDSQFKRATRTGRSDGAADGTIATDGFPRYTTWLDAHNATVAIEESEAVYEVQKRARLEALSDESKSLAEISAGNSINDDDGGSLLDEDEDDASTSVRSKESGGTDLNEDEGMENDSAGDDEENVQSWVSEDEVESDESEGETDEDDEEEEDDFDEEAYMQQLEEEAFERELRRVTMDALDKGKNASRKQVGDSMISGSQIIKKKSSDPSKPQLDPTAPSGTGMALDGGAGISFHVLKKGSKGKVEAKELVVPADTNLAMVATRQDDAAARERDVIKQRVLRYEEQSAEAEFTGGNVYLEQEKLQVNRNRPLSMEEIDKNFGTSRGDLPGATPTPSKGSSNQGQQGRGGAPGGGRGGSAGGRSSHGRVSQGRGTGRGRGRGGRGGRSNASGRTLFGS